MSKKPTASDLLGSDPDFTGDESTDEYMRRIRGREPATVAEGEPDPRAVREAAVTAMQFHRYEEILSTPTPIQPPAETGDNQCGKHCGHDPKFKDEQNRCWYGVNGSPCGHRCGWVTIGRITIDRETETETFTRAEVRPSTATPGEEAREAARTAGELAAEFTALFDEHRRQYATERLRGRLEATLLNWSARHSPPTEATQVAVEAAAKEISSAAFNLCEETLDNEFTPSENDIQLFGESVAAVIRKHCADAGEVERREKTNG